ncbi:MAG: amidohydrolase family protein [Gaiellaceae bacterium]
MPSYDVHQHIWPDPVVDVLRRRNRPPRLERDMLELEEGSFPVDLSKHELEARLALLDRDGIDVAVVSLPPTLGWERHPELADAYHAGVLGLAAASGGRLLPLACGTCLEGFAGACVSAAAATGDLGALPGELRQAGRLLFVHPGPPGAAHADAPPWWAALASYTAQMQAAYLAWIADGAERHPGLHVVFAILAGGAPIQLERLRSRGVDPRTVLLPNVHLEIASYGRRALELSLDAYGVGQLLYGSDTPVIDSRPTLNALSELGERVRRAVLAENPGRLFA